MQNTYSSFYTPPIEPVIFTPNTDVGEFKGAPTNKNFLSQFGYKFQLMRLPGVEFNCQKVSIPGIKLGDVVQKTPFAKVVLGGDHIEYDIFPVTFKVDEDLQNWEQIFTWMTALGPQKKLDNEGTRIINSPQAAMAGYGRTSDGTVHILTNLMNPNFYFYFKDMVPLTLSPLNFNSVDNEVKYITCDATFRYSYYNIKRNP